VRSGEWKIVPPVPMPAMRNMLFATAGFGRIARAVLQRARVFGCQVAAYDPYVSDAEFSELGVCRLGLDEVFEAADIVSLHLPLVPETRQLVNRERLGKMKPHAVLINTARGGLIDTCALAEALSAGRPGFAGLDVFETEPVEPDHPLRSAPNVLLTSHTAWYSSASVKELQRLAAEEAVRCLRGEPFKNPVIH
jgi:D-3-phosphoglycerate dehydrogenase